jgi:hypothetical protein
LAGDAGKIELLGDGDNSHTLNFSAQFIAVCRSVKTSGTCENLPPIAEPVSQYQEILTHAAALVRPPTLQC